MISPPDLPANIYAERMVLGSLLLRGDRWGEFADRLCAEDFSLDSSRMIWRRMGDLARRGETIDMASVAAEMERHGELQSGIGALVYLTEHVPEVPNIASYVRLVREASLRRRIVVECQRISQAACSADQPIEGLSEQLMTLSRSCVDIDLEREFASIPDVIDAQGGLDSYCQRRRGAAIEFPWPTLQRHTGGMRPGELIIIAGESGGGKSALLANIIQHAATRGVGVALYSMEMTREQICDRQLALAGRFNSRVFRSSDLAEDAIDRIAYASGVLLDAHLWIADAVDLSVQRVISSVERLRAKRRVDLVAVDYLQLMSGRGMSDVERIGGIARGLKNAASHLGVPLIAVSQYAKATAGPHRSADDLRGSSEIKHAANLALLLAGEQHYHTHPSELLPAKLRIDKQRDGASKIEIDMLWRRDCGLFVEAAEEE